MDYQNKLARKLSQGFTLIELLIVISITIFILGLSTSTYTNFKSHSNLEITTNGVVEAIRLASSRAQVGRGDSKWGVKVNEREVVIFRGNSYSGRDPSFNESLAFPSGISSSGISEVVFEKLSGATSNTGDIFISNNIEEQKLTINSYGVVSYGLLNTENVFSIPIVSSPTVTSITPTTVTLGANVTSLGIPSVISERGICYGTTSSPTNCVAEGETTTGIFTKSITGLTPGAIYYYRGYATNATGTAYSEDGTFMTLNYPLPMSQWNFSEGSGCVANDSYGINNGILKNNCPSISPSWVVGKIGNALSFNGSSNNVSVNNSANLNFTTSMSVSAWIKWNITPSTGSAYATIINKNGDNQYRLQHNGTNSKFEFGIRTNTGGSYATSITTPVVGEWYHLVGTWDGVLVKIYVNGVLEQTVGRTGSIYSSTIPVKIGSSSFDARWFNGIIDEVNLWDRVLTQTEVTQVYSSNL